MDKLILSLYQKIEQEQISNNRNSIYWIFHIENVLTKENGVSKRYLKVLFFNRFMNENNQLMRLYLRIHDEMIEKDDFVVSNEYQNPNIMGFLLERDLIDESKDVEIIGYVINGKKQDLASDTMIGFPYVNDQKKYQALCDFTDLLTKEMITSPYFDQAKWVCACGFANHIDDEICPICAAKKKEMQAIGQMDLEGLVLENAKHNLKLNNTQPLRVIVDQFCKSVYQKYGISREKLLASMDIESLAQNHQILLKDTIEKYINSHTFTFSGNKSFEQCLEKYLKGVVNDAITKDMVFTVLDVSALESEYTRYQAEHERKAKVRKRRLTLFAVLGVILLAAFIVVQTVFFSKSDTNSDNHVDSTDGYEGIEIINTYENRKQACAENNAFDKIVNPKLKTVMEENQICDFGFVYNQEPNVNVITKNNKQIRPLDESHVMVMQTDKIDENTEKIIMYIADLNGNEIYSKKDQDYIFRKYENGRVVCDEVYADKKLMLRGDYTYEDEDHYQIRYNGLIGDFDSPYYYSIYSFKYGKLIELSQFHNEELESLSEYEYQDDEIKKVTVYNDRSKNSKMSQSKYVNGFPIEIQFYEEGKPADLTKYYYDNHGLIALYEKYDAAGTLTFKSDYTYDFGNGKALEWCFQNSYVNVNKLCITTFNLLLSIPDYDFKHFYSFPLYNYDDEITLYDRIPNLYNNAIDIFEQDKLHNVETFVDANGKERSEGVKLNISAKDNDYSDTLFYLINPFYTTLTGTIVTDKDVSKHADISFVIYGDDIEIYRKDHIKKGDEVDFQVNLNGVKDLKIECSSKSGKGNIYIINSSLE